MVELQGFDNMYVLYINGDIYSKYSKRFIKPKTNHKGYIYFGLRKNGRQHSVFQHRLIAEHFIDNPYKKTQVNHINCIKSDNRVENLEWVTQSENQLHAYKNGKVAAYKNKFGKDHNQSKEIVIIKETSIINFENISRASDYLNCSVQAVSMVLRGINKTCKGFNCYYL